MKANVVLPPSAGPLPQVGDPPRTVTARGVVLFMHGFAQGPTAYARMLTELAEEAQVVVVAPCPDFSSGLHDQQKNMIEAAAFWRQSIFENNLPGLKLKSDSASSASMCAKCGDAAGLPVGLLAHSVGGGLAPYVVDAAARRCQPFKVAHVMAPQTGLVVCEYRKPGKPPKPGKPDQPGKLGKPDQPPNPDGHDCCHDTDTGTCNCWDERCDEAAGELLLPEPCVATRWTVQYGLFDMLSPAPLVVCFIKGLKRKKRLDGTRLHFLGTHVGFEDQLVVNGKSATTAVMPGVLAVLWGALAVAAVALGVEGVRQLVVSVTTTWARVRSEVATPFGRKEISFAAGGLEAGRVTAAAEPQSGAAGGDEEVEVEVELPGEGVMAVGYLSLAAAVTAVYQALPSFAWDTREHVVVSLGKGLFLALAAFSWPALALYPCEAGWQRPEARRQVLKWCKEKLAGGGDQAMCSGSCKTPGA